MKKIIVAVDGSPSAMHAADMAAQLAQSSGAELTVATSVVPIAYPSVMMLPSTLDFDAAQNRSAALILADAEKRISSAHPMLKISTRSVDA